MPACVVALQLRDGSEGAAARHACVHAAAHKSPRVSTGGKVASFSLANTHLSATADGTFVFTLVDAATTAERASGVWDPRVGVVRDAPWPGDLLCADTAVRVVRCGSSMNLGLS